MNLAADTEGCRTTPLGGQRLHRGVFSLPAGDMEVVRTVLGAVPPGRGQ